MGETSEVVELLNVPLEDIEFGARARKRYDNLHELIEAFRKHGVIQPIALQRQEGKEKPFILLAGGRRYSAAVFGKFESIPARIYPSTLDPLDRREIELMENLKDLRKDLDHREEAWLTEEIHRLNIEKFGAAHGSSAGHSAADTARMLGVSAMTVSRNLALADGMRRFGEEVVAGARTQSEALNALKRAKRREEDVRVSKNIDTALAVDQGASIKRALLNGYIVGDFLERIKDVPDKAVQFVDLDPPYGIELNKIKKTRRADTVENYSEIEVEEYPRFLKDVLTECYRVMIHGSWVVCWHAFRWYEQMLVTLRETGFDPVEIPAIWYKTGFAGQTHVPQIHMGSCYEPFIYARKGEAVLRILGRTNTFPFQPIFQDKKIHPTEKPIELMQTILETFVSPNSHVMVPFLGSGNTLLAAANLGCTGFGFDLAEEFKDAFSRRVVEGKIREFKSYG